MLPIEGSIFADTLIMGGNRSKFILCVEDDEDDVELICSAIQAVNKSIGFVHSPNGNKAYTLLTEAKKDNKHPCLIILDQYMPLWDGARTVVNIKKDESLSNIPIIIFTHSVSPENKDLFLSYEIEVVEKPANLLLFYAEIKRILKDYCAAAC